MKAISFYQSLPVDHPESFVDVTVDDPNPGARDLLVEVQAISVNPVDAKIRGGGGPGRPDGKLPILGWDAAGIVRTVGSEVTGFASGDEVYYAGSVDRPGCYAQLQCVDERLVARKPRSLDFAGAAALPLTTITAWEMLFDRLRIGKGAEGSLLIVGGAGGVGSIAIQLARQLTAMTVIATASRAETSTWCQRMAPLTRMRSEQPGDVPGNIMVEYYSQRASEGGFIITEATTVSITGRGYLGAPGIYSDAQVAGWKKITAAVHAKGGVIFLQLWHVGRASHVEMTGGVAPVSASVTPFEGGLAFTSKGWVPVSPHRALDTAEIPGVVEDFRRGAERAKAAGFDGVELHGANGYLLDQFLQDNTNHRTDAYGGTVENRARLLLEVTRAVISVWGSERVAVRLGPASPFNGMADSNPAATFAYVAEQLDALNLAYLHLIEPRINGNEVVAEGLPPVAAVQLRHSYHGTIIAAGGFEPDSAEEILEKGDADLVAFGRHFIANPDLPKRIELGLPLNPADRATFYGGNAHGYTDYPVAG